VPAEADTTVTVDTGMKKVLAGCFVAGALVGAQCAAAADLSLAPLYKAPPAELTQAYNWTGFYLGLIYLTPLARFG
jgi:hypothetical protein